MRILILTIFLIFISQICIAPVLDFEVKMLKIRLLIDYADRRHHELEFSRFLTDLVTGNPLTTGYP